MILVLTIGLGVGLFVVDGHVHVIRSCLPMFILHNNSYEKILM